ncbi:MAG: UvrD-helicase domain-containing protein [Gammaproteobacteria bacterium]
MSELNPRQRRAVAHVDTPLLVLAGAGSGKTRVITEKIAHLIRHCDIDARHIIAVTFTNKAAKEMRERATKLLDKSEQKGLWVSTFHTLGLRILKQEHERLGYRRGFSVFDASDTQTLLKELLKRDGDDDAAKSAQWTISAWKSGMVTPDEALASAADPLEAQAARLYGLYERSLRAYNGFDFDDLIGVPVRLLQTDEQVLREWRHRVRYVLADEYQDTNLAQYAMLKLLAGKTGQFTVVGDDDQSIYTWRGANPENLQQLKADYPALKVVKLEQNYRSSGNILDAANQLIGNNPHLFEKSLWSAHGPGDLVRVLRAKDEHDEVRRVVSDIMLKRLQGKGEYDEFAVLYRGNHQARLFEQGLRAQDVPYHLSGGRSFFERAEVRDVLAYLRLMANVDDDTSFLRIVNVPRREVGAQTLEGLSQLAHKRDNSLFASIFDVNLEDYVNARGAAALNRFARIIVERGDEAERNGPIEAVNGLLEDIDYKAWLSDTAKDERMFEKRMENVIALTDWLQRIVNDHPDFSLSDVLNHIALLDRLDDSGDAKSGQVRLMTLHAAKGLEFNNVYLVGFEEGTLPHHQNLEDDGLLEERRLAYVGITRARKRLTLSFAAGRRRYGENQECDVSRFLSELPEELLEWDGEAKEVDETSRQKTGAMALAQLRDMLS